MKNLLISTVAVLIINFSYGQIDPNLKTSVWVIGKETIIFGNKILRLEGENISTSITNVGYQSIEQIKDELLKKAEREMWTEAKKKQTIYSYGRLFPGGRVSVYLTRSTNQKADAENFELIIHDKDDKENFRTELKPNATDPVDLEDGRYSNYTTELINKKIELPFFIYIIDKVSSKKFKFEVKI